VSQTNLWESVKTGDYGMYQDSKRQLVSDAAKLSVKSIPIRLVLPGHPLRQTPISPIDESGSERTLGDALPILLVECFAFPSPLPISPIPLATSLSISSNQDAASAVEANQPSPSTTGTDSSQPNETVAVVARSPIAAASTEEDTTAGSDSAMPSGGRDVSSLPGADSAVPASSGVTPSALSSCTPGLSEDLPITLATWTQPHAPPPAPPPESIERTSDPHSFALPPPSNALVYREHVPFLWRGKLYKVLVQGVVAPLDASLQWMWEMCAHPDLFLYVVMIQI